MKLIVTEHIDGVAEPVKEYHNIYIDPTNGIDNISAELGLAKGDIIVFRGPGDAVRLPVGTDGQVLMADSSEPLGMKWADLPAQE